MTVRERFNTFQLKGAQAGRLGDFCKFERRFVLATSFTTNDRGLGTFLLSDLLHVLHSNRVRPGNRLRREKFPRVRVEGKNDGASNA